MRVEPDEADQPNEPSAPVAASDEADEPSAPVAASAPGESGWSFRSLIDSFAARFPWWLRKMGVRDEHINDATQDLCVEIGLELSTIPTDSERAERVLIRLASRIACRRKRDAQRADRHVSDVETYDSISREDWIAARLLWAEALNVLDERSKKLFIAHEIEGRSYASIAAEMRLKEGAIEKRGAKVKALLRAEILRLLGKDDKGKGSSGSLMALVFGLDSFDRALFRTMYELEEQFPLPSPASGVRPSLSTGAMFGGLPTALIVGAMLMLPEGPPSPSTLWAAKMGSVRLPDIVVSAELPSRGAPIEASSGTIPANGSTLPRKVQTTKEAPVPQIDKATKASLMHVRTPSLR